MMWRALVAIVIVLALDACTTKPTDTRPPYRRSGYQLLFAGSATDGCLAAFQKDALLYIVSGEDRTNALKVTVYNPASGLFMTLDIQRSPPRGTSDTCLADDFERVLPSLQQGTALWSFRSSEFRRFFDQYEDAPDALKAVIDGRPPNFRNDGKWKGETPAVNIQSSIRAGNLREASERLRAIGTVEAQRMIDRGLSSIRAAEQESASRELERQKAARAWADRLQQSVAKGDSVCTYDTNLFGNVESFDGDKIKVYVIGRAHAGQGFFFSGMKTVFSYEKMEAYRWFDRGGIAHCHFEDQGRQPNSPP